MDHTITFWEFAEGSLYTTAMQVEDYGGTFGATVRIDPGTTNRHPGSVCNGHIKVIKKNQALRLKFNLQPEDIIQLNSNHGSNFVVVNGLVSSGIVHVRALKNGMLDLYSKKACEAIVSMMLEDIDFKMKDEHINVIKTYSKVAITSTVKRFDKVRERVNNSLLTKGK